LPASDDFPIENLPFGVVRPRSGDDRSARVVVRLGDSALDLAEAGVAPEVTRSGSLNALLASGRAREVRERASVLAASGSASLLPLDQVDVLLPITVGDYVDFYSSIHHATNLGRLFRPDSEPLLANWRHLPVGYHGRAGTIVVSGTPVARPAGLVPDPVTGVPVLTASRRLDIELEVGFVVGRDGTRLRPDDARDYVFGAVLLNDWSARDIQAYEYQPLGPHLGKSFATTISPWVVPLDVLAPYLVEPPSQVPAPDEYLRATRPWGLDLHLEAVLNGTRITSTTFAGMYWTFAQQLAHMTVNGASVRAGDLFGSGTVSGPTPGERGSLVELSWGGREPITLDDGTTRTFLEDGDTVVLRGWCGGDAPGRPRVGFGEAVGTITPAP
jgi:fumarylacetoacetase